MLPELGLSRRRILAAAAAALLASGCGFRPRGRFSVPFKTLYIQMSGQSPLTHEIRRRIEAETSATVVDDIRDAEAILSTDSTSRTRVVNSYNDSGDAREYRLGLDITFRLTSPEGYEFMPATTLSARRDIPYTYKNYLSRETEEATLYRDIEKDIAIQLLRRLEAAKPHAVQ
ncbi:LPS assembly lipoprotein LptE [Mesosutterella sp. OilRF-GAM-744-9]|uniref:LPS-assembly lipoprotein LptE n=1 Tax=Mesosutterella porci TaxID=2915351 RepID=A0ABS9MU21_9BURK|nr:LPS assembly lipoprotein LptE [Mesosutterella sp. oilRF-744-WT-GAM-9]MCG5031927.1 LPS assembly lipoprotein LptE [Mesosutterella sp. oilRF-744-WT-GAM-9]